jgi:hypothetical protein
MILPYMVLPCFDFGQNHLGQNHTGKLRGREVSNGARDDRLKTDSLARSSIGITFILSLRKSV